MNPESLEPPIYLDYAATTPVDERVLEAMLPYFRASFGNAASQHFLGREAAGAVQKARAQLALLINGSPDEVIWTSGATEANNRAIKGTIRALAKPNPHVVTQAIEHKAIQRGRKIKTGTELLRLALAHGPGGMSLRDAAGWSGMLGLGSLSNPAVKYRLDNSVEFLPSPLTCWRQDRPARLCTGRDARSAWPMAPAFPNPAARALTGACMASTISARVASRTWS